MTSLQNHLRQSSGNNLLMMGWGNFLTHIYVKRPPFELDIQLRWWSFFLMWCYWLYSVFFLFLITVVLLQLQVSITCTLWDRKITVGGLEYTILNLLVCCCCIHIDGCTQTRSYRLSPCQTSLWTVSCVCKIRFYAFFSFSKSRISMRSFSSLLGSGALGVSVGFSSSFLAVILLTTLMSMKIQKATIRKSKVVCRKLP